MLQFWSVFRFTWIPEKPAVEAATPTNEAHQAKLATDELLVSGVTACENEVI